MPPASFGGSPRSVSRSDPGSFHITAFALGPRVCKILCVPFKSEVSTSYSPLTLAKVSPASLQSQTFWGLSSQCRTPKAGESQCEAQTPRSLGRTSAIFIILLFVGHLHGSMGLDCTVSLSLLPLLLWFLLYIFSCRRSFLVDSGFSHQSLLYYPCK